MNSNFSRTAIVAHRGDAACCPENTLAAFASAEKLGIRFLELDVQLSADRVPLVLHDDSLARTHGLRLRVTRTPLARLAERGVLAGGARPPAVPLLREFSDWLRPRPRLRAFVEIKKESIAAHGRPAVITAVATAVQPVRRRTVLISYDARVLIAARRLGFDIGYVLAGLGRRHQDVAGRLAPEFLFAEAGQLLRKGSLWPGRWQWAAFEVADPVGARDLAGLGVDLIETMNPAALLAAAAPASTR